jgi:hypothetical protein
MSPDHGAMMITMLMNMSRKTRKYSSDLTNQGGILCGA